MDFDETQPAGVLKLWPFGTANDEGLGLMAAIAELRGRIHVLEESDREKSAAIEAHRLEISELKSIAHEQQRRFDDVLSKLDLGFSNVTALLNGLRAGQQPFSGFK